MDPDATIAKFLDCIIDNNREEAIESLLDLQDWLERGGARPRLFDHLSKATSILAVRNLQVWIAQSAGAVGAELNLE